SNATATIHEAGSTGIGTTAADMGRFMAALLAPEPRVVTSGTVGAMLSPQLPTPRGLVGLGVYSPVGLGGNAFVGHDGGTGGFQSTMALLPAARFGVFASYNSNGTIAAPAELLQRITERFFPDVMPS